MDKIILKDQTSFEIADGASLGNIQIKAENFDTVKTITDAFTADNLAEVTFTHNGETFVPAEKLMWDDSYVEAYHKNGINVNEATFSDVLKLIKWHFWPDMPEGEEVVYVTDNFNPYK